MVESGWLLGKGRIYASTKNFPDEYMKRGESVSVPKNGRICASADKLSRQVPKNGKICVSTKKLYNSSEYGEKVESVRVPKTFPTSTWKV